MNFFLAKWISIKKERKKERKKEKGITGATVLLGE
jgi:hypothetical protein